MPVFPENLSLSSGARPRLITNRLRLQFKVEIEQEKQSKFIESLGLRLIKQFDIHRVNNKSSDKDESSISYPANNGPLTKMVELTDSASNINDPDFQQKLFDQGKSVLDAFSPVYQVNPHSQVSYSSNVLIVNLKKEQDVEKLKSALQKIDVIGQGEEVFVDDLASTFLQNSVLVRITDIQFLNAFKLKKDLADVGIEAETYYESAPLRSPLLSLPTDPLYLYSSGDEYSGQWNMKRTEAGSWETAWDLSMGSDDVTIAIIDNGCNLGHADLSFLPFGETFKNGLPRGTNGGVLAAGSMLNHGTMVAGVIGARMNNSIGVAGMAPNCGLLPVALEAHTGLNLAAALDFVILRATNSNIKVINISHGWYTPDLEGISELPIIDSHIESAVNNYGILICAASGNEGKTINNLDPNIRALADISYPARHPMVMAVGASDMNDCLSEFSNFKAVSHLGVTRGISVVAPGERIPTTSIPNIQPPEIYNNLDDDTGSSMPYFSDFDGTSAAVAHVSGLAGLLFSMDPSLSPQEVRTRIEYSADKTGCISYQKNEDYPNGEWSEKMGYGRMNAYQALRNIKGKSSCNGNNNSSGMNDIWKYLGLGGLILGAIAILCCCFGGGGFPRNLDVACADVNSKVIINTADLSIECESGDDCLLAFPEKEEMFKHDGITNDDPLFTGYEVQTLLNSTSNCNEPPSGPELPDGKKKRRTQFSSLYNSGKNEYAFFAGITQEVDEVVSDQGAISNDSVYFLFTCVDRVFASITDDYLPFIGVSVFEEDYDEALDKIRTFVNDNGITGVLLEGPTGDFSTSFTVKNKLRSFVTIIRSDIPNRVVRVAYRNQERFGQSIILAP